MIVTNNGVKYIQLDIGFFDNKKIKAIRSMPSGSDILVIWIELLVLAGQINDCGSIYFNHEVPFTDQLLSSQFGFPVGTIQLALATFSRFGMIEIVDDIIHISNWERYQNEEALSRIRTLNAERQRRYRQKEKEQKLLGSDERNVTETLHVTKNALSISNISSFQSLLKNGENEVKEKEGDRLEKMFELFYDAYGNKKGKKNALKAFARIKPGEELFKQIMDGVEKYHQSRQWKENYRKEPATWLNGECWNDDYSNEIDSASQKKQTTNNRKPQDDDDYYKNGESEDWPSLI